ncbi:MAG: dethiobiotin synthase [Solirubrobacterales bacterium]
MSAEGVFVTGTGTEVGKTVVAATVAQTLAREGRRVAVFKPAVTGLDQPPKPPADGPISRAGDDLSAHRPLADHELLRFAAGSAQNDGEIAPYRYGPPASPHLAASMAGEAIEPGRLLETARAAAAGADALVCEGVGGLLVPLTRGVGGLHRGEVERPYLVRDLAIELGYPLVVVASPGLGTINHTLLTLESARAAGLEVAMVVLTPWSDDPTAIALSNLEAIAGLGQVEVQTLRLLDLSAPSTWPDLSWRR